MHHHGVTFSFAKVCSPAIFETCFSYDKDLWIAATGYYMYFYVYNYIPRQKSGIYWIQVRRAAAAAAVEISLWTR